LCARLNWQLACQFFSANHQSYRIIESINTSVAYLPDNNLPTQVHDLRHRVKLFAKVDATCIQKTCNYNTEVSFLDVIQYQHFLAHENQLTAITRLVVCDMR